MPQYLVAIQHPENYDPSLEGEAMIRDIGALNEEMDAAGARFFAGGLESASHAKSLRKQPDGNVWKARIAPTTALFSRADPVHCRCPLSAHEQTLICPGTKPMKP